MGCSDSKAPKAVSGGAAPVGATAAAPAEPKPEQVAGTAAVAAPVPTSLKLAIASAHGLRPADVLLGKSDVRVEVMIEGKPESKVTTSVVTAFAQERPGAEKGTKPCVDSELKFDGELKGYVAGDRVVFTVKDKDIITSDLLGKATVSDGQFGGKLVLEQAGEGYEAFLLVQLGDGGEMAVVKQAMVDAAETAKQKLAEAQRLAAAKVLAAEKVVHEAAAEASVIKEDLAVVVEGMVENKDTSCWGC